MSPDDIAVKHLGHNGCMLSGSKSSYLHANPKNVVFFNANLYNAEGIKIWYGDLDITKSRAKLQELAKTLGETLYVTREMPFRFEKVTVARLEREATVKAREDYPAVVKITP